MSMQTIIEQKLASEFDADYLQVENESHMHSVAPGSESHFKVTIVSHSFNDQMLIKRHRMVNSALQQEIQQIHALALHTLTPQEWQARAGSVADSPKCRGGGKSQ
ncbi:MAG: BolA/IbaG family iron-sulfur metabolism protein [Gammaproteobacteria bacterium]|nr:BolA/IbaG family iron-sulfur metabolism protein [Gammaproteobacteria bacterium]